MRHILREMWSGLRRNASMTLAVIVTMWVSLTLFGAGLLVTQQVDLLKGNWYDRIEISVFLCVESSRGDNCEPGVGATDAERSAIETALRDNPEVRDVYYESKADAWVAFREAYANDPILETMTEDMMQDSFRIKLVNPEEYQGVVSMVRGMPGVQAVRDLRDILDPLFAWLNMARWATVVASGLLLLAAALQIGNTIRMAAFSRRREIGIMRLVGASNWYIMLPFLLESLLASLIGAALASGSLAAIQEFVIVRKAKVEIKTVTAWIGWEHVGIAVVSLVLLGVVLSIIPTLIATRRFLRV
ncbi:MAG: permease-like cell division protein FtsX [Actinobacteria bacterium]|nr:permease-like cell division protein FtsX [Actinomycetota bacterium]